MESCTVTCGPSPVEADPELVEVQEDAVRFPPGVNLHLVPLEALAPPPPAVALIREFHRDKAASVVRNTRECVCQRDVGEWGRLQAAIIRRHKG
jgi:hypothetical protein